MDVDWGALADEWIAMRKRAEVAEAQVAVQLAANEDIRGQRNAAEGAARAAQEGDAGYYKQLERERDALCARLEGLREVVKGTVMSLRKMGQSDTDDVATDLQEAAARAEGKVEPEEAESLRPEELQAEADSLAQAEAELSKIGLWPPGKALSLTREETTRRIRARLGPEALVSWHMATCLDHTVRYGIAVHRSPNSAAVLMLLDLFESEEDARAHAVAAVEAGWPMPAPPEAQGEETP